MAISGPSGNNPLPNLYATGLAPKNRPEQVSPTEKTSVDNTTSKAERLREEILGDGFVGRVNTDALLKTAGASPASSAINFNEKITATSALGEPSSVTAITDPGVGESATLGNTEIAFGHNSLLRAARLSRAGGISGDFNFSTANEELAVNNKRLASVG